MPNKQIFRLCSAMMSENFTLLKQGAEARLYVCEYLGLPTLVKERFKKEYRHVDLDTALTKERIKNEARAIVRAKIAKVKTPTLYLVDFERRRIYMEYYENSITVKDFIINIVKPEESSKQDDLLQFASKIIGETVRMLHDCDIIHGDLTSSNLLFVQRKQEIKENKWLDIENIELAVIDFGLAHVGPSAEDKGVDLYVLERALISTHNDFPELFSNILSSYKDYSKKNVKEILRKFEEVRARGRKRTMVG